MKSSAFVALGAVTLFGLAACGGAYDDADIRNIRHYDVFLPHGSGPASERVWVNDDGQFTANGTAYQLRDKEYLSVRDTDTVVNRRSLQYDQAQVLMICPIPAGTPAEVVLVAPAFNTNISGSHWNMVEVTEFSEEARQFLNVRLHRTSTCAMQSKHVWSIDSSSAKITESANGETRTLDLTLDDLIADPRYTLFIGRKVYETRGEVIYENHIIIDRTDPANTVVWSSAVHEDVHESFHTD